MTGQGKRQYAQVLVIDADQEDWYAQLEGRTVLAELEFSIFNGELRLFAARPIDMLPVDCKRHRGRPIHPKHISII